MGGHVFIVRGDITRLACDAWLMPCDQRAKPNEEWYTRKGIPGISDEWKPVIDRAVPSENQSENLHLTFAITNWPEGQPRPWPVNIALGRNLKQLTPWHEQRLKDGTKAFFARVVPEVKSNRVLKSRARPLLALPLIATGGGGAEDLAGEVVRVLLPTLYEAAEKYDVDIVLVTHEAGAYAASIVERNHVRGREAWSEDLEKFHLEHAERLAAFARQGRLSLFIGAGVSAGAGVPLWSELLDQLAQQAKIENEQRDSFDKMDVLDQASLIASRLAREGSHVGNRVSEILQKCKYYALGHAMLATLPVNQVITTNYDTLFEDVCKGMEEREIAVLPWKPANKERWLLKMHGDVNHPEDIVLIRSDYMRYDERRSALRGIVQTMLITGHMLFVGFSFTDDNLYYVMDDVHRAVSGEQRVRKRISPGISPGKHGVLRDPPRSFGTALRLQHDRLFEELWRGDLKWVWFDDDNSRGVPEAARRQEIFLDYLASLASDTSLYLLNDRYKYLLSEEQKDLKEKLRSFAKEIDSERFQELQAWQEIQDMLKRFGYKAAP